MKAGIPSVISAKLILETDCIMRKPTKIKAGAVAQEGTRANKGVKNKARRKKNAVTTEANPVRAPAATPEEDSTKEVTVEVPRQAPATVPTASARRAPFTF